MFEQFTERSRLVMGLANGQAARWGAILPEHLLLALLERPEGLAWNVLRELHVDVERLRAQAEAYLGTASTSDEPGPTSAPLKKVIEYVIEEARQLGHTQITTGHMLLGLLRNADAPAAAMLSEAGAALEQVRRLLIVQMQQSPALEEENVTNEKAPAQSDWITRNFTPLVMGMMLCIVAVLAVLWFVERHKRQAAERQVDSILQEAQQDALKLKATETVLQRIAVNEDEQQPAMVNLDGQPRQAKRISPRVAERVGFAAGDVIIVATQPTTAPSER